MIWFFAGLAVVALLTPLAIVAVRHAKRRRGGAIFLTGLLLVFGMNMQITPPPPQTEQVQRQAGDDEPKD